jgi:hypothetical protein
MSFFLIRGKHLENEYLKKVLSQLPKDEKRNLHIARP